MSSASSARSAVSVSITSSSLTSVTCATSCRVIFSFITRAEHISRSIRIAPRRAQYTRQLLARSLPSRRSEVCIIVTNVAPRELLWRQKWHPCFRMGMGTVPFYSCIALMQWRQDPMHGTHVAAATNVLFDQSEIVSRDLHRQTESQSG